MEKIFSLATILLVVLLFFGTAVALGPKLVSHHEITWDNPNSPGVVVGYYVYWRATGGTFVDTQRAQVPGETPPARWELLQFNLPRGNYDIGVSAYNVKGESGLSNTVPFVVDYPLAPSNAREP